MVPIYRYLATHMIETDYDDYEKYLFFFHIAYEWTVSLRAVDGVLPFIVAPSSIRGLSLHQLC